MLRNLRLWAIVLFLLIAVLASVFFFWRSPSAGDVQSDKPQTAPAAASSGTTPSSTQPSAQVPEETALVANAGADTPTEYWTRRCNDEAVSYCEIFQRLVLNENNTRLIEFAVGYPASQTEAQAVIVLPLGIIMTDGITLRLDGGAPSKAMVRTCNESGCFIVMNLPDDFVDSMRSAQKITVTFLDGAARTVNVELSLEGFAGKLAALKPASGQ